MVKGPAPQEPESEGRVIIDERPSQMLYYPCTDVRSPSWIASGESVVFEVLREYLGPRDFVTIWFDHKWERANNTGIDHEVFSQVTAFAKYLTQKVT